MDANAITLIVILAVLLCLCGYLAISHRAMRARLAEISDALDEAGPVGGRLAPFSWDLMEIEEGLPLLGEGLTIRRCGVYLVGTPDRSLLETLEANIIYQLLSVEDLALIFVSRRTGPQQLGRRLLSLENGGTWEELNAHERRRAWGRMRRELQRYESSLYMLQEFTWGPESLLEACEQVRRSQDVGAILVDDSEIGSGSDAEVTEFLERLRLIANRYGAPIFLLMPMQSSEEKARWQSLQGLAGERVQGILEFEGPGEDGRRLRIRYVKYPEASPASSFELNVATGQIVPR